MNTEVALASETPRHFARGKASTSVGTIFTAPSGRRVELTSLSLYQTNAATQTIGLFTIIDGVQLKRRQTILAQDESGDWFAEERPLILEPGSSVALQTTTADAVNYELEGYELPPIQTVAQ